MSDKRMKIGLALSGGGFRAAAFHLGVFRKLNELGILDKIDVISTISGGSIAGTYYCLHLSDFNNFSQSFEKTLQKNIILNILLSLRLITSISILFGLLSVTLYISVLTNNYLIVISTLLFLILITSFFQFIIFPFSNLKEKAYKDIFFKDKKLSDLPDKPIIAINSTNLETGTLFTFSKKKVSDSSYEFPRDGNTKIQFKPETINLSFAVACSTAVPVPFNPYKLKKENFLDTEDYSRVSPSLSDGGLYDNQGIHKLTQSKSSYECDIIICSDGSQPFDFRYKGFNSFNVLYRTTDIMMRKIKSLQFIRDVYGKQKSVAYFSIDWEYEKCVEYFIKSIKEKKVSDDLLSIHNFDTELLSEIRASNFKNAIEYIKQGINYAETTSNGISNEDILTISRIKTNLTALSKDEINLLTMHASVLTELQLRLYCPTLLTKR